MKLQSLFLAMAAAVFFICLSGYHGQEFFHASPQHLPAFSPWNQPPADALGGNAAELDRRNRRLLVSESEVLEISEMRRSFSPEEKVVLSAENTFRASPKNCFKRCVFSLHTPCLETYFSLPVGRAPPVYSC
ncbi:hypothetical protein [Victivallis sp. Marseille-Q1083]|uniref:hypothetical protein n=1 Tax=Victivallis sp. Marseille-Q1083 TaxID=2717288 RepID=UPI001588D4BD|nr:hypothetical protein [Victivallis sp. Marseille-Q1083]